MIVANHKTIICSIVCWDIVGYSKKPDAEQMAAMTTLFNAAQYAELETMMRALTVRFPEHGVSWQVLSVALLLRLSLGLAAEAAAVEAAVAAAIDQGVRTADIARGGTRASTTRESGSAVVARIQRT